jgi:hypothetical protein
MPSVSNYLYLRGLRQVDHTVFCVDQGQKTYRDPLFPRFEVPYSSGQQVKRSVLDDMTEFLNEPRAAVTFNFTLSNKGGKSELSQGEPWSPCDPTSADQLIGGWMRAGKAGAPVKRRSPLSISAMRPLHPSLAGLAEESITFDRSDHPEQHILRVVDDNGNEIPKDKVAEFLLSANRNMPMRLWIPKDKVGPRAAGLFIYDVAIDLRTLFTVSTNINDPELDNAIKEKLLGNGWTPNSDETRLICPVERREKIIPALAHSLINWRITSNQSRTYSPQNTLAVALSDNANKIGMAIRAELSESSDYKRAEPVIDDIAGVQTYTALTANAYIPQIVGASADALEQAEAELTARLLSYNYEL